MDSVDEYGDDFEDYDEVLEDEVELKNAAPKQQVSTLTGAKKKSAVVTPVLRDLKAIYDAVKYENSDMASRAARVARTAVALESGINFMAQDCFSEKLKPTKGTGVLSKQSTGGKYIAALGVLDSALRRSHALRPRLALVSERYVVFDQSPLSEYQLYQLILRSAEMLVEERGIGTSDKMMSREVQSERVRMVDVEMQFANGNDDTEFENRIVEIMNRTRESLLSEYNGIDSSHNDEMDLQKKKRQDLDVGDMRITTKRLPKFVQNVSPVVLTLLDQSETQIEMHLAEQRSSQNRPVSDHSTPLSTSPWKRLGSPVQFLVPVL